MNKHYRFHDKLVLRTPRLPLSPTPDETSLKELIRNDAFLEAIYLASPVLHEECIKWREGRISQPKEIQKISRSLIKYYTRMTSRSTPFGLFSGCAVVDWTEAPTDLTVSSREIGRHTRLDMHYLCALAQRLAALPGIREQLLYYPNTSIYAIGEEIRYVEYKYVQAKRQHQISSVVRSEYLATILERREGMSYEELVRQLAVEDVTEEEAIEFINELIAEQLLVHELEPAITGPEFIYQVIAVLKKINGSANEGIEEIIRILEETEQGLKGIDGEQVNAAEKYRGIMELLNRLEAPYDESKLFQTDIVRITGGAGIHAGLQKSLEGSLTVLNKLIAPEENATLQSFIRRFTERYEDKEMPLLEVLDTETGIGYLERRNGDLAPLVEDLQVPGGTADPRISWSRLEQTLHAKLQEAGKDGDYSILIRDEDLEGWKDNWEDLPPSMSVMFRLTGEADQPLYLESAGGSSAANLLGRFAHADPAVLELIRGITAAEQAQDPGVVYAEIIHLPESRIGNILLHPSFRDFEIPYLAKSSLSKEYQLDVKDLLLSVRNGRVVLRSRRLNRPVIPRLSTAHNFHYNALPVYQLLCDLQNQGKRDALGFHWGSLNLQHRFLPRVVYRDTILCPATWNLLKKDLEPLFSAGDQGLRGAVEAFREKWRLPRYAVLADGDNELLVDLENEGMVQVWLEMVKSRNGCVLKEFFHRQDGPITDEGKRPYANQLVAVLMKNSASYQAAVPSQSGPSQEKIRRKFSPGSEWLYYKVYCGVRSSDKLLLEAVKPLTEELQEQGLIGNWFFIRYSDPAPHLRLRLRVTDTSYTGIVMSRVAAWLSPFEASGYIWKLQLDTYTREIERYGSNTIEAAETFFHHDSRALLKMLDNTWGDERETLRWAWGMRSVEELLNSFQFLPEEKLELLTHLKDSFGKEFNMGKPLRSQLTDKYRTHRSLIGLMMDPDMDPGSEVYPLLLILREKSAALQAPMEDLLELHGKGELEMPLFQLAGSYIHMLLNRLTTSNPRLHELVIYDFLFRHHQSLAARKIKNHDPKVSPLPAI